MPAFNPRRIAILKPSALGDIAHSLPVLSGLRELFPTSHIAWVVNSGYRAMLDGHPDLNEVIPFERGAFRKQHFEAIRYSIEFAQLLRRKRFDLVIDLQGLLRTGLMAAATGAPVRLGFNNAREGSRRFYSHRFEVPDADRIHAVDRYWRFVEWLGGEHLTKQFQMPIDAEQLKACKAELSNFPRPWLALAPGARWLTKRWPLNSFAELANRMHRDFGGTVVLVGAADDNALSAELKPKLHGPVCDFIGRTNIAKMVALLSIQDALLSNDTGPLHVAAALGVPCVAPYLCTKPILHGPYRQIGISTTVPCAGSYLRVCPNNLICFPELTPDKLWPSLQTVLQSWRTRTGR